MADFHTDFEFMEDNEDRSRAYAIVPDDPPGAHAISGINSAAYPAEYAAIAALPQNQRGPAIENFYRVHFWNQFEAQLPDVIAERVLDMAVNSGPGTAIRILQKAVNQVGGPIVVDGGWGLATVAAANACNQEALLSAFRQTRLQRYKDISAAHPEKAKYLGTEQNKGPWWVRALQ